MPQGDEESASDELKPLLSGNNNNGAHPGSGLPAGIHIQTTILVSCYLKDMRNGRSPSWHGHRRINATGTERDLGRGNYHAVARGSQDNPPRDEGKYAGAASSR